MTWTKEEALEGLQDKIDKIVSDVKLKKEWERQQLKVFLNRWQAKQQ
jgi:hypothetical protein